MEKGKTAAQEEAAHAADPKTEQEKKTKEDQESSDFRDHQQKVEDGLNSLQINQLEGEVLRANKAAVEVSGRAFELQVKEVLSNYPNWLSTKKSTQIDGSADIVRAMIQTESGLNLVREKVRDDEGFKKALNDLFVGASNNRDEINKIGQNLEGRDVLFIRKNNSWMEVEEVYDDADDERVIRRYVTVETENPTTGEIEVKENDITKNEQDRRYKIFRKELEARVQTEQQRINAIADVLGEIAPEAK